MIIYLFIIWQHYTECCICSLITFTEVVRKVSWTVFTHSSILLSFIKQLDDAGAAADEKTAGT